MKKIAPAYSFFIALVVCFITTSALAQHSNLLTAVLNDDTKEISIKQEFTFHNTSKTTLQEIYFNDWANAYSDKNTGLAKR